jgi:hypothetical protein
MTVAFFSCFEKTYLNLSAARDQGCQTVWFQAKNPNFGKIWRALEWKMLLYFGRFGIFYGHLV